MDYNYDSRLNPPDKSIDVNMEKPAVIKMMQILSKNNRTDFGEMVSQYSDVKYSKITMPRGDSYSEKFQGKDMDIFVVEPTEVKGDMVFFHGGAYALPVQSPVIDLAVYYARNTNRRVFIPEYILMPDAKGEEVFKDCINAWNYITDAEKNTEYKIDTQNVMLYGESAGGALATGLTMYLRDHDNEGLVRPCKLMLIYPVLDNDCSYESKTKYADAAWSEGSNESMWNAYLTSADEDWMKYLVPMSNDDVSGFPATYVEPQEMDILHDEAVKFFEKLQAADTQCEMREIPGSYHSFDYDMKNEYVRDIVKERLAYM
ncbi:MAG: alpha/beta hydrolase [Lachnospiraceae bacterium]|nr:alpha/beta hydrolase [Lachnospiraceae bacterium]